MFVAATVAGLSVCGVALIVALLEGDMRRRFVESQHTRHRARTREAMDWVAALRAEDSSEGRPEAADAPTLETGTADSLAVESRKPATANEWKPSADDDTGQLLEQIQSFAKENPSQAGHAVHLLLNPTSWVGGEESRPTATRTATPVD